MHALLKVRLTEVSHQAAQTQVIAIAHRLNQGQMPELRQGKGLDFYPVEAADPRRARASSWPWSGGEKNPDSVRAGARPGCAGTVSDKPSGLGARSLNIELQRAMNLPGEFRVERFGWTFCPGDKVTSPLRRSG